MSCSSSHSLQGPYSPACTQRRHLWDWNQWHMQTDKYHHLDFSRGTLFIAPNVGIIPPDGSWPAHKLLDFGLTAVPDDWEHWFYAHVCWQLSDRCIVLFPNGQHSIITGNYYQGQPCSPSPWWTSLEGFWFYCVWLGTTLHPCWWKSCDSVGI